MKMEAGDALARMFVLCLDTPMWWKGYKVFDMNQKQIEASHPCVDLSFKEISDIASIGMSTTSRQPVVMAKMTCTGLRP